MKNTTMNPEKLINELSEELAEVWYAAEDWGEDKFTQAYFRANAKEEVIKEVFEGSLYFAIQELLYGETGLEILKKLVEYRTNEL